MDVRTSPPVAAGSVIEYQLDWPGASVPQRMNPADPFSCCLPGGGSTHELVYARNGGTAFWVSGQNYDHIARIALDGSATYYPMPVGSLPHGMTFDHQQQLWVTFEGHGQLAQISAAGTIVRTVDVSIHAEGTAGPLNSRPHGIGVAADGAIWFTGKLTNTVGRVDPVSGAVQHIALPSIGAVPIYLSAGPDGAMWCTELGASNIARIAPNGTVTELSIPTPNSRPIAVIPGPDGASMWFSEEAGGKVGRIGMDGRIDEFPIPLTHRDAILAGLAFDRSGNLWVQQYITPPADGPTGDDYIVRLDRAIVGAPPGDLSKVDITYFKAPSQRTVMHRITQGPDGDIWFSELGLNRIGKVVL
jgi:virginiamycin B lyase